MKRILIFIFIVFLSIFGKSQEGMLGVFLGGSIYNGEVNQRNIFYLPSYAVGGVYQHLFNDRFTMRVSLDYTLLKASDNLSQNQYQLSRNYSFATNLYDIGVFGEFNFLKFNTKDFVKNYYSPYLIVGAKFLLVPDAINSFEFGLPIGVGFKYLLTRKTIISFEWIAHYTNSDELDLLPPDLYLTKQRSYNPNNDWYHLFGVVMTFNIFKEKQSCPGMHF